MTIVEDLLVIFTLEHTTAEEAFTSLNGIKWEVCVRISTDGTRAMTGKYTGLIAPEIIPPTILNYCCIHRKALISKKIKKAFRNFGQNSKFYQS